MRKKKAVKKKAAKRRGRRLTSNPAVMESGISLWPDEAATTKNQGDSK